VYAALAAGWLALVWRDARAGLAFCAGPLLAPIGLIGLLPLAVQPARGAWRRAAHAFVAVPVAAAVAGLHGGTLPLTAADVPDLGLAGSERPGDVLHALATLAQSETALLTTAFALALTALLLPGAVRRGQAAIVALCLGQAVLILAWAPQLPWVGIVLSSLLLGAALSARPLAQSRRSAAG
jgi:hypothetical protein